MRCIPLLRGERLHHLRRCVVAPRVGGVRECEGERHEREGECDPQHAVPGRWAAVHRRRARWGIGGRGSGGVWKRGWRGVANRMFASPPRDSDLALPAHLLFCVLQVVRAHHVCAGRVRTTRGATLRDSSSTKSCSASRSRRDRVALVALAALVLRRDSADSSSSAALGRVGAAARRVALRPATVVPARAEALCSSGPCVSGCHDDLSIELRRWPVSEARASTRRRSWCTTSSAPGRSRRSMQWHHETALAAWCDLR